MMTDLTVITEILGLRFLSSTVLNGGAVGQVFRVETTDGPILVKKHLSPPCGMFAAEATGLEILRLAGAFRVPEVLGAATDWLALEFLESVEPGADFGAELGTRLAALHRFTAPAFGLEWPNYLGPYPQYNRWTETWATFYATQRLLPQIEQATLSAERKKLLVTVLAQVPELLLDHCEPPALLHGDLWSGNVLSTKDGPALIDPAVYFGVREVELAYLELFNGFPDGVFAAYDAAFPLDPGYGLRRPLYQLYPLLVHFNYFGEKYGPMIDAACRTILSK